MNFITIDCFPKIEHSLNRVENKGNKTARKIFGEGVRQNSSAARKRPGLARDGGLVDWWFFDFKGLTYSDLV
jgi:hypothetical protein